MGRLPSVGFDQSDRFQPFDRLARQPRRVWSTAASPGRDAWPLGEWDQSFSQMSEVRPRMARPSWP
jgi:hypothetical protein